MNAAAQSVQRGAEAERPAQRDAARAALPAHPPELAALPTRDAGEDQELALELEAIVESSIDVLTDEVLDEVMAARLDDGAGGAAS
jgi:hypothetical protein